MHTHIHLIVFPNMSHTWFYCKPTFYLFTSYVPNQRPRGRDGNQGHCAKFWKPSQHWKKTPWAAKTNYDERVGKGSDSELSCRACVKAFKFPVRGQRLSLLKLLRSTWGMFNSNAVGQKEMFVFSQSEPLFMNEIVHRFRDRCWISHG